MISTQHDAHARLVFRLTLRSSKCVALVKATALIWASCTILLSRWRRDSGRAPNVRIYTVFTGPWLWRLVDAGGEAVLAADTHFRDLLALVRVYDAS